MSIREIITDYSKGDYMGIYWALFWQRERCENKMWRDILTFILNHAAHRHGGYIGNGARFTDEPLLPHGLQGIYISRYASIGMYCCIYQNVTIGEVDGKAPQIGNHCLIGAGAILIGDIKIGDHVKIGAGSVVGTDIPDRATVVPQPARIILREANHDGNEPGLDRN
jgi:serine O-acetyltransferase